MSKQYDEYPNRYSGCYTVHIDVRANNDRIAVEKQVRIVRLLEEQGIVVSQSFLTDADDWAEHIHHDDHPDAVRVGIGRRVVLDENGFLVP